MTNSNSKPLPARDAAKNAPFVPIDQALIRDVRVEVEARLGRTELSVESLMALKAGSIVTLETGLADHVDIYLNNARVARGEIVAVGDCFGVRIVELAADR
jgi:flagellar motor switch protein FliN/FliY